MANSIKILLTGILFIMISCGEAPSENEKFQVFHDKYEKVYSKMFAEVEEIDDSSMTVQNKEKFLLRQTNFCKENLDALSQFDLNALSKENQTKFKNTFQQLKTELATLEMEAKLLDLN